MGAGELQAQSESLGGGMAAPEDMVAESKISIAAGGGPSLTSMVRSFGKILIGLLQITSELPGALALSFLDAYAPFQKW